MPQWIKNFAPDVAVTMARFPLAIALSLLSTLITIALTNIIIDEIGGVWIRLVAGLSIAAVFAVAGVLYGESNKKTGVIYWLLAFGFPAATIGLLQVESSIWIVAPMLAPISLLWLSLSPFTKVGQGREREEIQDKFWWMNHRAITTAIVAGVGFAIIALGLLAIERAMSILFSVRSSSLFYQYLLPFTGMFLTPVYWISTIPRITEFSESEISEPDFLSRAIGFLGQFVLTPFLLIYALILLAYAVQSLVTQSMPQGMLSWMVLGFTIVGAANWLVLHPKFLHSRPLVKAFRASWFWLTIVPIGMYLVGVSIRIDVYGFTSERVGLVVGGLWIVSLTLAFLSKKFADIRLIPGLALLFITLFSIGPWNLVNLPEIHQAERLDAAIHNARPVNQSVGGPYTWTDKSGLIARGAIVYLAQEESGRSKLFKVLDRHGIPYKTDPFLNRQVILDLDLESEEEREILAQRLELSLLDGKVNDVSATPYFYGDTIVEIGSWRTYLNLSFGFENDQLLVRGKNQLTINLEILDWMALQTDLEIITPDLNFVVDGQSYKLIIRSAIFRRDDSGSNNWIPWRINGLLFSATPPREEPSTPNPTTQ